MLSISSSSPAMPMSITTVSPWRYSRAPLGRRRLPRRHPQPTRLALGGTLAHLRPTAPVLRHQRWQHGLDDQPLTRPIAKSATTMPTVPAVASAAVQIAPTLAYCQRAPRSLQRRPQSSPAVSKTASAAWRNYDYWSDKVRRSIVLDAKCDLLVYGMGERPHYRNRPPTRRPAPPSKELRNLRGVAYRLVR